LLHDALTLADLQYRLFKADFWRLVGELVVPGALILMGAVLLLSCLPIALATIALTIHEAAHFSLAASFGFALAGGLILGAAVALAALLWIRRGIKPFERSRAECDLNMAWIKKILKENAASLQRDGDFERARARFE
jgi:hypothetical protein